MTTPGNIHDRLARWRGSGDPRDLWPGIEEGEFRAAIAEIARVTRAILAGSGPEPIALAPAVPPRVLGVAAFASGMGALLGYWTETGRIVAAREFAAVLAEHLAQGRARAELLGRALGRILDTFAERGISAAVLKGMHTAWVYFPEPGTRPCADVDLLVAPQDFGHAAAALKELGFHQGATVPDPPRTEWLPPEGPELPVSLEVTHRDNPWAIDLHATLDRTLRSGRRAGLGSPSAAEWVRLDRDGRRLYGLPQPLLLAALAFHTASHLENSPLVRYVELVLVIRRDFKDRLNRWEEFLQLVNQREIGRLVYPALELAESLAPGVVPREVRQELRRSAPWLMRRVLARLRPERAQQLYRMSADVRLMWLGSTRDVVEYLGGALRPRGFLRAQLRRLRLLLRGGLSVRAPD